MIKKIHIYARIYKQVQITYTHKHVV